MARRYKVIPLRRWHMLRSHRVVDEHCREVARVAGVLGRRGLSDLADDLRLSVRSVRVLKVAPEPKREVGDG